MEIEIVEGPVRDLQSYASIPISFVIRSRMDLDQLWLGEFAEIRVTDRIKDYDELESIATLADRFDVKNWAMLTVQTSQTLHAHQMLGGTIIAFKTPGLDMLEGRDDLAVLWDIRVHPVFRNHGIGKRLLERSKQLAKKRGCNVMRIETQDTNVEACRFYRRMGCRIHSIQENAYEGLNEAKIIWTTRT